MNRRITTKTLLAVLGVFLFIIGIFLTIIIDSYGEGVKQRQEKVDANIALDRTQQDKINECEKNVAVTNTELSHIKDRLTAIEDTNNVILLEIRKLGNVR